MKKIIKSMIKKVIVLSLAVALGLSIAGCANSTKTSPNDSSNSADSTSSGNEKKYIIRLGVAQSADHPQALNAYKFKELAEKNSNGRIEVNVFPSSQLGSQIQMNEGVQSGSVTMTICSFAYIGGNFEPKYNAFSLPFLITEDNLDKAWAALDGEIGKELAASIEKIGIKPMGYGPIGFRHITNSKREIHTPDDLKGIKVRLQPNNVHIETFKALGGNPTSMDWSEVYSALQQKVIDAQENPVDIIASSKIYEVQKYLTLTGHFYDFVGTWMNKDFYDQLPSDLQKVVSEASIEAAKFHRDLAVEKEAGYLQELKDAKMEVYQPTKEEIMEFQNKSSSVYEKFLSESKDKEFVKKVWKALGRE